MQEVLKQQLDYFRTELPEYEVYGIGHDDGMKKGEHCPILYCRDKFDLLEKTVFGYLKLRDNQEIYPGILSLIGFVHG